MKNKIILILITVTGILCVSKSEQISEVTSGIEWFQNNNSFWSSCIRITASDGFVIIIDPVAVDTGIKADLILITHSHNDHFSRYTVQELLKEDTVVIATEDCIIPDVDIITTAPGDINTVGNIEITSVPAYMGNEHKKEFGWIGYILDISGTKV